MLNRCTHRILGDGGAILAVCSEPLDLFGIRGTDERRERWYNAACGFFTVLNDAASIVRMTREEPQRGYFNHDHDACKQRGHGRCIAG